MKQLRKLPPPPVVHADGRREDPHRLRRNLGGPSTGISRSRERPARNARPALVIPEVPRITRMPRPEEPGKLAVRETFSRITVDELRALLALVRADRSEWSHHPASDLAI